MSPREVKRWAANLAALRAIEAAQRAASEGNAALAQAKLALVAASLEDLGERLDRDVRAERAGGAS